MSSVNVPRSSHTRNPRLPLTWVAGESGQILTELAIVMPLILFAILTAVGLGQAGQRKALVVRAAASAARVAVVRQDLAPAAAFDTIKAGDPYARRADVKTTLGTVTRVALPPTETVKVTVVYRYRPLAGFGWRPTFNLQASFTIDKYQVQKQTSENKPVHPLLTNV